MCRYAAPPGHVRTKPVERPEPGPLLAVIDAIPRADEAPPPRQRHTAKRILGRRRDEHGFTGGDTTVKDDVRVARARVRRREVFVPLAHPPGHARVDFGEAVGISGGERVKRHAPAAGPAPLDAVRLHIGR